MEISRRKFLGTSAAAVVVAGTMAKGKVFGANDKIQVGCIGIHGRGGSHIRGLAEAGGEIAALCDVDQVVLDARKQWLKEASGKEAKTYGDMRELFADDSIDVVSIATPNHWHSLATIWACQAGKDVYVEKPLSHNIWEGRQLVEAVKKYGRIVQHGTQRRSDPRWLRDIKLMHEGFIGDIYMARALCYKSRGSIGAGQEVDPPATLDWDRWQGPAEEQPYRDYVPKDGDRGVYVHYNWHWCWNYGNGDIGNQGVHQMDVATWGMNKGLPVKVASMGGRYTYEDDGETPNTQVATMTYEDGTMLVFEVRGRYTNDEGGVRVGNLFYGSKGYYVEGKGFFNEKNEPMPVEVEAPESAGCYANFLNAVRTRNEDDIYGNALDGHIGSAHCHLANVAYRLGEELRFDPKKERFIGSRKANKMLSRDYRKPFAVPKIA